MDKNKVQSPMPYHFFVFAPWHSFRPQGSLPHSVAATLTPSGEETCAPTHAAPYTCVLLKDVLFALPLMVLQISEQIHRFQWGAVCFLHLGLKLLRPVPIPRNRRK